MGNTNPPVSNVLLEVVVAADCRICSHSLELASQVQARRPEITVTVVDAATLQQDYVIATPTFRLNGHTVCLGNPELAELMGWVDERGAQQS